MWKSSGRGKRCIKVKVPCACSFYCHSSSSMTQLLTTFSKILFTKDGFSGTKCTKIVFVFGRGSALDPAGGASRQGRGCRLPIPLPLHAFGDSVSGHLATLDRRHNTHTQPFNGLWSGTNRVGRYQKKHSRPS